MTAPNHDIPDDVGVEYDPGDEAPVRGILAVKRQHEGELMERTGVTGVGIGRDAIGDDAIVIYLEEASAAAGLPTELDGYNVVTEVTGIIDTQ